MCLYPFIAPDGTALPCRTCWQCGENRVNDLVGRCMAEQATADQTFSVTLTYAGDTPNAAVLCYRDIQQFLKRFRKAGYSVRYIVAGEYGTIKGRAHWHMVLFLKGKTLDIVSASERQNDWQVVLPSFGNDASARIAFAPWSDPSAGRGFAYFQEPDYGGLRYCMKYALKQQGADASVKSLSMSKKPPLGYEFFMNMADDLVDRQMPLQLPTYAFLGEKNAKGKHRQFCLQGRMRELFCDRYAISWALVHGAHAPASDWFTEAYLDKIARLSPFDDLSGVELRLAAKVPAATQNARKQVFDDLRQAISDRPAWVPDGSLDRCFFSHLGNSAFIYARADRAEINLGDGGELWIVARGSAESVERQLLSTGLKLSALKRVSDWLLYVWRD